MRNAYRGVQFYQHFKGLLLGLRQFLVTESPLKIMKNVFFILKALFVLKGFKYLSWFFGHAKKEKHVERAKFNFQISDITDWITNSYITPGIDPSNFDVR